MHEERAYVEWLRGQEEKKDIKPAVQLVSKIHLLVIPHCDPASFLWGGGWGWEWNVGWQKNRLEGGLGAGTDRWTYFSLFFLCLFYTSHPKNVRLQLWLKGATMYLPTTGFWIKATVIKKTCIAMKMLSSFEFFLFFMTLPLLFVIAILGSIKEILDRPQFRWRRAIFEGLYSWQKLHWQGFRKVYRTYLLFFFFVHTSNPTWLLIF